MRTGFGYLPQQGIWPFGGLNSLPPETLSDPRFATEELNVLTEDGVVRKRAGYHRLGSRTFAGTLKWLVDFRLDDNTRFLVALTTRRQYYWDPTTDSWKDITKRSTKYTIDSASSANKTFTISDDGDLSGTFSAGDPFHVTGSSSDTNDGEYTIASVSYVAPDFTITVEETIPDDTLATLGEGATDVDLTGTDDDYIDAVNGKDLSSTRVFMTNGVDTPRTWNGTDEAFIDWAPTFTGFVTCKTLEVFNDHLILGNLTTSSDDNKTVAWSDTGDFDQFDSGNAGTNLLADSIGSIKRVLVLADRCIIYNDDSIHVAIYVGGDAIFQFDRIVHGTRLLSPMTVVNLGPWHVFCSQENIWLFDGTRNLRAIGDRIRPSYKADLDLSLAVRCHAFNDVTKKRLFFAFPSSYQTTVVYTLEYDLFNPNKNRWDRLQFADEPTAFGFLVRDSFESWDDSTGTWEESTGAWNEESLKSSFPVRVLGASDRVFLYDESTILDDDATVESEWQSVDFVVPEEYLSRYARWSELQIELSGTEVEVQYSTNRGSTWTTIKTLTLDSEFDLYTLRFDVTSRHMRIRLRTTSSLQRFSMRWYRIWFLAGGPR